MMTLPNSSLLLPVRALVTEPTEAPHIWGGLHLTVELYREVEVRRVASNPLGLSGEWYALGAAVETPTAAPRVVSPGRPLGHEAHVTLLPGTVLNVGVCGPLLGRAEGELQAEVLRGPASRVRPLDGWWGDRSSS